MTHDPLWITFIKALVLCLVLLGAVLLWLLGGRLLLAAWSILAANVLVKGLVAVVSIPWIYMVRPVSLVSSDSGTHR